MISKKFTFYLITLFLVFVILEVIGYLSVFLTDDLYDDRETVLARVEEGRLADLRREGIDPIVGWKYRGPEVDTDCNCQGTRIEYAFDQFGARLYSGYDSRTAEIVLSGDSYTHGYEVAADDSFAAVTAGILGVSVANHGVGGYGPVQAFLSLQQNLPHYPRAKFVVLGIMYENIFRMVNSYRPVLTNKSSVYGLKPYIAKGHIKPHPGRQVLKDIDTYKAFADRAFDTDFWGKPKHAFPFSVSYIRGLGSNYCYFKKLARRLRRIGVPEFFLAYRSDTFSIELLSLLNSFREFAKTNSVKPVVLFIPRDRFDTKSVSRFIERNKRRFQHDLIIGDVGTADVDWEKYNLLDMRDKDNIRFCHPSPYGHRMIAEYLAKLLVQSKME
jgi:hypothetical protein